MTDPHPVEEIPLAYANVRSSGAQQLLAIKQAIFATSLFLAVLGFIPGTRAALRAALGTPESVIILSGFLFYAALAIGSLLGLLRVRAGKWITIVSLTSISLHGLFGFFARPIGYGHHGFGYGLRTYYLSYSLPTLWAFAFSVVAIIVLTRQDL